MKSYPQLLWWVNKNHVTCLDLLDTRTTCLAQQSLERFSSTLSVLSVCSFDLTISCNFCEILMKFLNYVPSQTSEESSQIKMLLQFLCNKSGEKVADQQHTCLFVS